MGDEEPIAAVAVKLPRFWPEDPRMWFKQVEAQFALRKITADLTKYHHVVAVIDRDTARRLRDTLNDPPTEDLYEDLKGHILDAYTPSRRQRARQLMEIGELGDRQPSELMTDMLALVDEYHPCMLFEHIFLERLPGTIRIMLEDEDFKSPRQVARRADKLMAHHRASHMTVHAVEPKTILAATIAPRLKHIEKPKQPIRKDLCYYHFRFREKAQKCEPGCKWSENAKADSQ